MLSERHALCGTGVPNAMIDALLYLYIAGIICNTVVKVKRQGALSGQSISYNAAAERVSTCRVLWMLAKRQYRNKNCAEILVADVLVHKKPMT